MIDLHMHSLYSEDGEFTPFELIQKCVKNNINIMCISDHNSVRANIDGSEIAALTDIIYVPGIEIDCTVYNTNFHLLGYGIDYKSRDFYEIEQNIEKQSVKASHIMLEKTRALGFQIENKDLMKLSNKNYWKNRWTGEMFAEVLLEMPEYYDHPLLSPYRPGGSRSDNPYANFYWDFYAQGKPCHAKIDYPPMEEVIYIIHRNDGKAVLAHPGMNLKGKEELLSQIAALGLDGIEVFSSYHTPKETDFYYHEAKRLKLYMTAGSDFHGKTKPAIELGKYSSTSAGINFEHANDIDFISWLNPT
ncbi:MAG: PHP domain-containing protein [Eubacterium sp.]